jgi:hypothetical protein
MEAARRWKQWAAGDGGDVVVEEAGGDQVMDLGCKFLLLLLSSSGGVVVFVALLYNPVWVILLFNIIGSSAA